MFLLVVNTVYVLLLLLITCKLKRVYIEMAAICCKYHILIDKVNTFSDLFTNPQKFNIVRYHQHLICG